MIRVDLESIFDSFTLGADSSNYIVRFNASYYQPVEMLQSDASEFITRDKRKICFFSFKFKFLTDISKSNQIHSSTCSIMRSWWDFYELSPGFIRRGWQGPWGLMTCPVSPELDQRTLLHYKLKIFDIIWKLTEKAHKLTYEKMLVGGDILFFNIIVLNCLKVTNGHHHCHVIGKSRVKQCHDVIVFLYGFGKIRMILDQTR